MTDAVSETDEALVDAVAKVIAGPYAMQIAHGGGGLDSGSAPTVRHRWELYTTDARAAIDVLRAHDEARGMVSVPREPTEAMVEAGGLSIESAIAGTFWRDEAIGCYTAMLFASREGE